METKELYLYTRNGIEYITPSLGIAYKRSDVNEQIKVLTF